MKGEGRVGERVGQGEGQGEGEEEEGERVERNRNHSISVFYSVVFTSVLSVTSQNKYDSDEQLLIKILTTALKI